jgi:biopolymer transport protein ExbD
MAWQIRHEGSPESIAGLTLPQIVEGLRDGRWAPMDEVKGPGEAQWTALENHPQLAESVAELEAPPPAPEDETRLDMNALIDVCLVLLIFFILTTAHATAIQKVVPTVTVDPTKRPRVVLPGQVKKLMVQVQAVADAKGKPVVKVEGKAVDVWREGDGELDRDKLRAVLRPLAEGPPRRTEMLLDAERVSWGLVIAIQDEAVAAGIPLVHHLNKRKQAPKGS